ncbi:hypothetical protein D3C75_878500 [compost metagenome]
MLSGFDPLDDAASHMPFQQQLSDSAERSLYCRKLIQYIIAVSIPFDHAFNTANLTLYPVQTGSKSILKFRRMMTLPFTGSMTAAVARFRRLLIFVRCHNKYLLISWLQVNLNIPPRGMSRRFYLHKKRIYGEEHRIKDS